MYPTYWNAAKEHLSTCDVVLAELISHYPGEAMQSKDDAFHTLMRSITGQQISVKAADAIWARLEGVSQKRITPEVIAAIPEAAWREIGFSRQKISYIASLSEFFLSRQHVERDWAQMTDEEVIKDITQIRGIGRWTAEMFLMFHLLRPDVLPLDDIGLINALKKFYHNGQEQTKAQYRQTAALWQPYRSVATWYLWRSYDDEPVSY